MSREHAPRCVVYVASTDTQDISLFDLRPDGELRMRGTVAVHRPAHTGRSIVMTVGPDRRFLYAGHLSGPAQASVSAFAIDARTGDLGCVGTASLADASAYLSTDRSGRFLLSASYAGSKVSVHAIDAEGRVGAALQVLDTEPKAHCILTDPSNRYVLHTSLGGDLIYQSRFDARTGCLTPNEPPAIMTRANAGPRFLVFAPNADRVYVINELDGTIDAHSFDPTAGTLGARLQTIGMLPEGFAGKPWGADIRFRPDGGFLYVSERTSSLLTAFAVDERSGLLSRIDAYATVRQPRAIAIDPSGTHLVAAGQLSNTIASYRIDAASGELHSRREYPVGKNPTWVEIVALR